MKKYYLHNGSEKIGPFDKEELKQRGVVKTTPIWVEGRERWTCAENYEDLHDLFYTIPPAQLLNSSEITRLKKKNKYLKGALLICIGLLLAAIAIIANDEIETKKNRNHVTTQLVIQKSKINIQHSKIINKIS